MLTDKIIKLREVMISGRVPLEVQTDALENLLAFYETHKARTGSLKGVEGTAYYDAMQERVSYAYNRTLDFLKVKGYLAVKSDVGVDAFNYDSDRMFKNDGN